MMYLENMLEYNSVKSCLANKSAMLCGTSIKGDNMQPKDHSSYRALQADSQYRERELQDCSG